MVNGGFYIWIIALLGILLAQFSLKWSIKAIFRINGRLDFLAPDLPVKSIMRGCINLSTDYFSKKKVE
jgi:hypothetical protein